jgi:NTE family protein
LARLEQPLHDRRAMWELLEQELRRYPAAGSRGPLLAVGSVDVMSGELVVFDSDRAPLTARHLAASSALPLLFEPVEIDERLYWDGDITRESVLPPLLRRLLESERLERDEALRLVTIEQFPRRLAAVPKSGAEIAYRAVNLLQLGKLEPPALDGIRIEAWQRVVREPLPEDGVSGQFDYSPQRIERLIEQGRQAAQRAIERPERSPAGVAEVRSARARR